MKKIIIAIFLAGILLYGCKGLISDNVSDTPTGLSEEGSDAGEEDAATDNEVIEFMDAHDEAHYATLNKNASMSDYNKDAFICKDEKMTYDDDRYEIRHGVDVSHHQGEIDWNKVKNAGFDFAFLRIGFRGYGEEGTLNPDKQFNANYSGAKNAGLDVGIYFFAQAVNEKEAVEEADYVLELLGGRKLDLPIVYDPESILDDVARTDGVSSEQFTANTKAFCKRIRKSGYTPAIYSNMVWEAYNFDMAELKDEIFWYADYLPTPQTPYAFSFWQYSCEGSVPGISGNCDLNIELIKKK